MCIRDRTWPGLRLRLLGAAQLAADDPARGASPRPILGREAGDVGAGPQETLEPLPASSVVRRRRVALGDALRDHADPPPSAGRWWREVPPPVR
eukprot:2277067-Pyramimonas_sp.AAC.1